MSIWRDVILQDLAATTKNALVGGPFGSDLVSSDYVPSGVPVIRGENLSGNRWIGGDFVRVSAAKAVKLAANRAKRGDIIFTQRGANHYKQVAIVPPTGEELYVISQSQMKLTVNTDIAHPLFIYYLFQDERQREYLRTNAISTGVPHTNLGILRSVPLTIPPLDAQQEIAATLGALDDKIELNRKMNATLESMARALFRDWFVDFGPTRAKMEGRAPYLSPDLWSLFPDRLDDEGKPEGWEEKPLDEVADFLNGIALQKFPGEEEADSLPVIKIAELRNGITANSNRASHKVPSQYVIKDGDFLFSWSGSLLAKFWTGGEGALNQHLFKVTSDRYPAWFFSEWVQHHLEEFQIIAASKATTMGHIQRGHLKAAMTICPPDDTITRLGEVVAPLIDRIVRNELESRTLAQTRDLLLPRLMSGELRVAEAVRMVEAAL